MPERNQVSHLGRGCVGDHQVGIVFQRQMKHVARVRDRQDEAFLLCRSLLAQGDAGAISAGLGIFDADGGKAESHAAVYGLEHEHDHVVDLAAARSHHLGHVVHAGHQLFARIERLAARVPARWPRDPFLNDCHQQFARQAKLGFQFDVFLRHDLFVLPRFGFGPFHLFQLGTARAAQTGLGRQDADFLRDRFEKLSQAIFIQIQGRAEAAEQGAHRGRRLHFVPHFGKQGRSGGAEGRHLLHPLLAALRWTQRPRWQGGERLDDGVGDLPFLQHGFGQHLEAATQYLCRRLAGRARAAFDQGRNLAVEHMIVRRHQEASHVLEQGGNGRFFGILELATLGHLAPDHGRCQRLRQFGAHALRPVARHAVDQQHGQRIGLDRLEAKQEDRLGHGGDRSTGITAIHHGVGHTQNLLRQAGICQHERRQVAHCLVVRRRHLHHPRHR